MTKGRAAPCRPWGSIPGAVGITAIWWLVAHSSGQGWVQALGEVVFGGLVVGVIGPWLVVRRIEVSVTDSPADAVAGLPVEFRLATSRAARVTLAEPGGPEASGDSLVMTFPRHGLHTSLTLEVATASPFGLQWWGRQITVPLTRPLHVAPRRGRGREGLVATAGEETEGLRARPASAGEMRAPRPYRSGDGRNLVHWPATAHTGELMVRDLEELHGPPAEMVVVLPPDPVAAEATAEAAMAEILAFLEADRPVLLTTTERSGTRTAVVADRRTAGRRLAAAVTGPA
ncbi:MAG TPA: DUF58 domain-containing protein [Acidimicrobiales bacterium]|nr:DUF58 domain-containing protein [Acidimicrobiales bacterium]